ncbi:hypothetical protein [Desulfovibrio aminophilus]|uniref:hypothetical protein n=1 Tax=Desulfovibrio aminophilus TaxID=81425 RepID=UPI003395947D
MKDHVEIFRLWLAAHPRERRRARGMTLAQLRELAASQGLDVNEDDLCEAMDAPDAAFFGPPEKPLFVERFLTRRGLTVLFLALLAVWLVLDNAEVVRENQEHINPAAVEAMSRALEACRLEGRDAVLRQCRDVQATPICRLFGDEIVCVLERRHGLLLDLGFVLPPLYEPGYKPRAPRWRRMLDLAFGH